MISFLRTASEGWTAKILLVLLIGGFAMWGVSGSMLGGANSNTVVQVGETSISIREYLAAYNRNMNEMQQRFGRRLTQEEGRLYGVESRTISNIVSFAVLDEFARVQSLALSEDRLAKMLAENPVFADSSGKFNRETFRQAVYNAQMRESEYIDLQNAAAIRGQVMQSFATSTLLPDVFGHVLRDYANEERKFSYITLTTKEIDPVSDPTDKQLKTYFEDNIKNYAAPEFRKLEILKIEPADLADESAISDEDVAADYDARLASYRTPERRKVQQIVFKSQELADAAVKAMSEGSVFETVLSDNDVTLADADLGFLTKAQLPEAVRDATFALELNTPSDILQGPFGPTMIRVTEMTPESTKPLEEVAASIRKDLALQKAADTLLDVQETVEDARAAGTSLKEIGDRVGVTSRVIEAIDRRGRAPDESAISDVPASGDLLDQAFQTDVGGQASPLDVNNVGYVWYDVQKIDAARDRTLDEVADKAKTDWIAAEQSKRVAELADKMKERLERGAKLDDIALELNLLAQTTGFLKRTGQEQSFPRSAAAAGFVGDDKAITIANGGSASEKLLITVAERKGVEAQIVEVPAEQVQIANQGAADDLLSQMIVNLQGTYPVTQNPTLINQVLTQGH
ncbi:MAG: SurA N-terminal domain-containing protein [Rhizobiaceae bacterium]